MVVESNGEKIYGRTEDIDEIDCKKAYYLIKAEISDGDEQPVILRGRTLREGYKINDIFWIQSVEVERDTIIFY